MHVFAWISFKCILFLLFCHALTQQSRFQFLPILQNKRLCADLCQQEVESNLPTNYHSLPLVPVTIRKVKTAFESPRKTVA